MGSKLNFKKKCILGTSTCKMVKHILNETVDDQYMSGKAQVMFKIEMETMFSSAQNKKLNKYDIDHTDNLEISSNHNRN